MTRVDTLHRLRSAAIAASYGDPVPDAPEPRDPTDAEAAYIAAIESFRAGRQCAGWDHFEIAEELGGVS